MNPCILETRGLTKDFAGFTVVDGVDLRIERGTIHAIIGPNGAGKTTCFNLLTGFIPPSAGRIFFDGKDITGVHPALVARLGMVRSFQISATFPQMTALENVRIALLRPRENALKFWQSATSLRVLNDRCMALLEDVGLSSLANEKAAELAYGRKRALEIATTIAQEPQVLLLDEPMAGLGQEDVAKISELILRVAKNRTVLMVEHNLLVVEKLCNTITVLTRGRVLAEGDYETVSGNPEVRAAYMGVDDE